MRCCCSTDQKVVALFVGTLTDDRLTDDDHDYLVHPKGGMGRVVANGNELQQVQKPKVKAKELTYPYKCSNMHNCGKK